MAYFWWRYCTKNIKVLVSLESWIMSMFCKKIGGWMYGCGVGVKSYRKNPPNKKIQRFRLDTMRKLSGKTQNHDSATNWFPCTTSIERTGSSHGAVSAQGPTRHIQMGSGWVLFWQTNNSVSVGCSTALCDCLCGMLFSSLWDLQIVSYNIFNHLHIVCMCTYIPAPLRGAK